MLPRLWLLVGSDRPTKGPRDRQTMSVIELSWTAKKDSASNSTNHRIDRYYSWSLKKIHCPHPQVSSLGTYLIIFCKVSSYLFIQLTKEWAGHTAQKSGPWSGQQYHLTWGQQPPQYGVSLSMSHQSGHMGSEAGLQPHMVMVLFCFCKKLAVERLTLTDGQDGQDGQDNQSWLVQGTFRNSCYV